MRTGLICFLSGALFAAFACAQEYPDRPIRFIVPNLPGGGNDTTARTLAAKLTEVFGQQVVVDNRAGAGGIIGAEIAAHSKPDGYTLFLGNTGSHATSPLLHARLGYDPVRDFAPISLIASAPLILVVHPSVPAKSVRELVQLARSKPGQINFASNGKGGSTHLAAELFMMLAGVNMVHVPYRGLPPAVTDLLSGRTQLMFATTLAILPQVRAGKLRGLAVTSAKRSAIVPELPSIAEAGVPGYETVSWYGVLAPAGTPKPIIDRLNRELVRITRLPDVRQQFAADGADLIGSSPEQFATYIARELARWTRVVKYAHIQPD
jgi:tripartite-type tricarboxylate transporter receptor subunit TctC